MLLGSVLLAKVLVGENVLVVLRKVKAVLITKHITTASMYPSAGEFSWQTAGFLHRMLN